MIPRRTVRASIPFHVMVNVHDHHCDLYAVCQQEAPEVFQMHDHRLQVDTYPAPHLIDKVRTAARLCPTQAITIRAPRRIHSRLAK